MNDVEAKTALSELDAVALTLWGEARNQPIEGIIAVGCVIRNRKHTDGWSWKTVVHKRLQFSCWWEAGGADNYAHVMTMARRLLTGEEIDDPAWQQCLWVAEGLMAGRVWDITSRSRHYLTTILWQAAPPRWAQGHTPVARIADHVFFNDVV